MIDSPIMEKRIVKDTTRRDRTYYNIYCNSESICDINFEQLEELYGIMGQFIEEKGGRR